MATGPENGVTERPSTGEAAVQEPDQGYRVVPARRRGVGRLEACCGRLDRRPHDLHRAVPGDDHGSRGQAEVVQSPGGGRIKSLSDLPDDPPNRGRGQR
jgi:hypothetical protein